jgi:hypothetical protein
MYNKKLFIIIAAGLIAFTLVIALIQVWGIPLKDVIKGIVVDTLYGVLPSVIFCALLFFIGVFGIYRILQERYHKQAAV